MPESVEESLVEALKMHMQTAKETQFSIYNSLLTFNGILISVFAIIVSIDATKYKSYIFTQFGISLISILGILVIMYRIRRSFQGLSIRAFENICKTNPVLLDQHKDIIEKNAKYKTNCDGNNWFIRWLDNIVLLTTFASSANLFRILYETNIGCIIK